MANIQHWLDQIRRAVYGREVRSSIADAIEAINKEQSYLDGAFDQLIINAGNSNAEVVAARVKADGTQFNTLGERLNKNDEDLLNLSNKFDDFSKEVINARTDRRGTYFNNLKARIDNIDEELEKVVVNVANYKKYVQIVDGCEDWKNAFDEAIKDLQDGAILLIPKHDYYISSRVSLTDKSNITVICAGVIMPINNKTPLIGTVAFKNLSNCIFNGLTLDGNANNIPDSNKIGSQSLLSVDDSRNLIFNNLTIRNTEESGVTSNGNLTNVIFNNIYLNNIGEHGFYFGGTNCLDIKFNNLVCYDIGTNQINNNRTVGVIKFRNKTMIDIIHDNIFIDGFYFESSQKGITGHRQLIVAQDVKNLSIKNGTIKGERTSVFSSNIGLDNFIIDNINLDGLHLWYGLDKEREVTPDPNDNTVSLQPVVAGNMNIKISNSHLKCEFRYMSDITEMSDCTFNVNGIMDDSMATQKCIDKVLFNNVHFIMNTFNIRIRNVDRNFEFNMCKFNTKNVTGPMFDLGIDSSDQTAIFTFNNCEDLDTHDIFVQSDNSFEIRYINSVIKGEIKTISPLKTVVIQNCKLQRGKVDTYVQSDVFLLNGVYDIDGNRFDYCVNNAICKSYNTSVNLDLRYKICKNIDLNKLLVTNNKGIPFEITENNNILTLSTITRQQEDTTFTVLYTV